jgi:hypothetical protein
MTKHFCDFCKGEVEGGFSMKVTREIRYQTATYDLCVNCADIAAKFFQGVVK